MRRHDESRSAGDWSASRRRGADERRHADQNGAGRVQDGRARHDAWGNGDARHNLGLPDARLQMRENYKIAIAKAIRELRPRVVILPYWEGRHPDHTTTSQLGFEGCFIAGLKAYPLAGEAFRPFKIIYAAAYADAPPTFAVDITAQYARRRRAILAYASQFHPPTQYRKSKVYIPLDELEERMSLQSRHYGKMIDVKYAEGFVVRETMAVDDVVKLPVRSI